MHDGVYTLKVFVMRKYFSDSWICRGSDTLISIFIPLISSISGREEKRALTVDTETSNSSKVTEAYILRKPDIRTPGTRLIGIGVFIVQNSKVQKISVARNVFRSFGFRRGFSFLSSFFLSLGILPAFFLSVASCLPL